MRELFVLPTMGRKFMLCAALVASTAASAVAQGPPGGGQPGGPPPGGGPGGPGGGRGFGPPPNPLMEALDTNKDGELSGEEIANAVTALKTLDKNSDGKLAGEEVRPAFRGFGGPGGPGGGGPGGGGNFTPPTLESMMARWKEADKDGDGKLTAEELGERGARMMETGDTNKDGSLDKAELEAVAKQFMERFQRGPGSGGQGGPGGGGRPPRPEGEGNPRPEA